MLYRYLLLSLILGLLTFSFAVQTPDAVAAENVQPVNLPGEQFEVNGRPAFVLLPDASLRQNPQPWIMYAITLPGYPDKHERWMHEQFLKAGVAVAGIDAGEAYGSPDGQKLMSALYEELTTKRNFAAKPALLGRSRGGLMVSSWAIRNTDKVASLAGIYPVYDLRSYPGLNRAAPAYKLTAEQLEARLAEYNPVSKLDTLAKAKIPVHIIHGDSDTVVPLDKNSSMMLAAYKKAGARKLLQLNVIKGQGHNYWPGFFRSEALIDFTIAHAKAATIEKIANLEYSRPADKPLHLDLYLPTGAARPLPVVVWVHGGGWKNGSKERCKAAFLASYGFAVASINYRLTQQAQWPAQINDCRAAVRWLRDNADKYNLDAKHIGAWGSSAGGHLVALMGTLPLPEDEKTSSRVQAVCDWFGPSDLLTMPPNVVSATRTEEDVANSNGAKLLGGTVRDRPELAKQASAFHQASKDDAPFLIMHGDKDPGVPLVQSEKLHKQLTAAGASSTLVVVEGAGHGGPGFQKPKVRRQVLEFFNKHLRSGDQSLQTRSLP